MLSRHGIRSLCCAAVTTATMGMSGATFAADEVKIGFLVKQAEEPWFQTEWAFAEKAGKEHGFTVLKIAVPDGEKTLAAIDNLAANGAKGFVICPPDVSLGPAIVAKAKALGMKHTAYVEPTGLSVYNVSTARDLTKLVMAARKYPMLSELSTTETKTVTFRKPAYSLVFNNTDHLVRKENWDIKLTKTGFTNQAGHCLVLLTTMANRPVSVVILDAFGKYTHFADASRLRKWMETGQSGPAPEVALQYKKEKNLVMKQTGIQARD
ncbi:substrate-binding domain-containing protein [Pseudomonas viridiflava]|uniref:substrate-binding domain-containing protein n=1 Tax=Pseudomonas viridiflava TaxID=33069 RepID=UPI001980BB56|nr:substrate-binding domain-containing protein [Pseudomonas viridiflava]